MAGPLDFPTILHRQVAELARDFMVERAPVDTVLVVNSCARGRATPESDVDLAVLVSSTMTKSAMDEVEASWRGFAAAHPDVLRFRSSGRSAYVHLDVFNGEFTPTIWDEGGGPDAFEIEIGNRIGHAAPIDRAGPWFQQLRDQWLPYYGDDLRDRRLAMVREACARDLAYVPVFLERGLAFQAFDRLYKAFQEFLQALFISRRVYPIAYNKWIREQVEEWLGLADLYRELPRIISVGDIESAELVVRAEALTNLLGRWTPG